MPDGPTNPNHAHRRETHAGGPPTADELLALVEGEALAPERAQIVATALANDTRLRMWVEILTDDRKGLQSLGSADASLRAPADLLERVEAQVEREALLGLVPAGAPTADELRTYERPRRKPGVLASPWFRFASIAAGVAFAMGGTIVALQLARTTVPPMLAEGDGRVGGVLVMPAQHGAASGAAGVAGNSGTMRGDLADAAGVTRAQRRARTVIRVTTSLPTERILAALERFDGQNGSLVALRVDANAGVAPRPGIMPFADADAAREGVLTQVRTALAAVHALDVARAPIPGSAMARGGSGTHGSQQRSSTQHGAADASGTPSTAQPKGVMPTIGSALPSAGAVGEPTSREVLIVAVPSEGDWIEIIKRRLAIDGVKLELVEADGPVTVPAPADLMSVLWWEQPVATWGPRVGVPVVIERR